MAASKSSPATAAADFGSACIERASIERLFSRFAERSLARSAWRSAILAAMTGPEVRIVDQRQRVLLAGLRDLALRAVPVLLLEDVGGALVGGKQVGAVLGGDEVLQRFHTSEKPHEIIFVPQREHGIDEVVPHARLALLDLEAVGEELLREAQPPLSSLDVPLGSGLG